MKSKKVSKNRTKKETPKGTKRTKSVAGRTGNVAGEETKNTPAKVSKYFPDESRREHNMAVFAEVKRRIAAAVERLGATPVPPGIPWLLAGEPEASVRRTIARLRAGTSVPADPTVDPLELADLKEEQAAYRAVAAEVGEELAAIATFIQEDVDLAWAELLADAVATLNAAKQLPEARDPDSEIAQSIRRMDRARRADMGNERARPLVGRRGRRRKRS